MKANRLAGHELPTEGRIYDEHGNHLTDGSAVCSCGTPSPVLPSNTKRQLWHKAHKDDIRSGGSGVVWTRVGAR